MKKNIEIVYRKTGKVNIRATASANGISQSMLSKRLAKGLPIEKAITIPSERTKKAIRRVPGTDRRRPEYESWCGAKARTTCVTNAKWDIYGARGIRMCRRWADSFEAFLKDMGPKPSSEHSVDRRDNDGNYSCGKCDECEENGWPANCRWATAKEQGSNKRNNVWVETPWGRVTMTEACRRAGVPLERICQRVRLRGISYEEALFNFKRLRKHKINSK